MLWFADNHHSAGRLFVFADHYILCSLAVCTVLGIFRLRSYRSNVVALTRGLTLPPTRTSLLRINCAARHGENQMFEASCSAGVSRWPLVRTQAGGAVNVVILAAGFFPVCVHWAGRSFLCPGDGCALCPLLPLRGLYYLPVDCCGRPSILELASMSSSHLEQHAKLLHGGLRPGLQVRLSRRSAKSPIHSEVVGELAGVEAADLMTFASRVMAIYQMAPSNPGETIADYGQRLAHAARQRGEVVAKRVLGDRGAGV